MEGTTEGMRQRTQTSGGDEYVVAAMDRDDGGGTTAVMVGEGSLLPFENDGGQPMTERTGTMASQPTTPKPFKDGGEEGTTRRLTRKVKDRDEAARKANLWRQRKCGGEVNFRPKVERKSPWEAKKNKESKENGQKSKSPNLHRPRGRTLCMARPRPLYLMRKSSVGGAAAKPRWRARATLFRNAQDKESRAPARWRWRVHTIACCALKIKGQKGNFKPRLELINRGMLPQFKTTP
ncbi:hypothetical protein PIB30_058492 [Stylosanthes scabra]|uniref:Uncharacterized protein n=1 Tax=Stylosanthes scabra TaxID=79078 RepID=A0ABU6SKZ9_9FABA|nr:hypothetical protein [Stylosanthes scabra]